MQQVLIVSESEEKYRGFRDMMCQKIDETEIVRSESLDEAQKIIRSSNVDLLVMEPQTLLAPEASNAGQTGEANFKGNARQDLGIVRSYIFTHYGEKLSLSVLSALISVTPNYLCHVFRQAEGIGVREFVENTRLERAAALLCGTEYTVSAIARRVGFKHESYFCQRFRETYGATPRKYRFECMKR